jgi:diguanylate cyclase (GGDEF)-like protein
MSTNPRNEMEEIEKQFEQMIEGLIALIPSEDQRQIIRKEANRREKVRLEVRAAKTKEDELKKHCEAVEEEKRCQRQRRFEEWRQLIAELEQLLANVSEARPLLQRMIELVSGCQEEVPGSAEGLLLTKKIGESRGDFQTRLEKELEELRRNLISSLPTGKNVGPTTEHPTHIDFVTGAYNFAFLDELLTWETARADRHNYPLTMLLIDLNGIKHVNDIYGHVVGGRVLRSVADLLRSSVRLADVVFRSGDDDFIVLLPFTDLSDGLDVRDRILRRAKTSAVLPARPAKVTMTIVMAQYEVGEGKESFVTRLDEALFRAMRDGDDEGMSSVWAPVR